MGVQTENFATEESSEEIIKKTGDLDIEENNNINNQKIEVTEVLVKSNRRIKKL